MMGVLKSLYKRGGLKATQVAEQSENNKKTIQKATLNHVGNFVVFPSMWYHHGYYSITPRKTVIQAQLFAMHSRRSHVANSGSDSG